jgi:hypothetical protein
MRQSVTGLGERLELAAFLRGKSLLQRLSPRFKRRAHEHCLFVAGVQRSGTNLLMEVLERSVETDVYHETDPRAFRNYQLRDEATLRRLVARSPAPLVVIKCLMESQRLRQLLDDFKPAQGIWMFRHYHDVVNSMTKSFGNQARQVARVARGEQDWWSENIAPDTLSIVSEAAATPLDDMSAAALQWFFRNRIYFDQALEDDPRIMLLPYEQLVTEPLATLPRVAEFSNVELGERAARIITPTSVGKRKPPAIRPDVDALCAALHQQLQEAARR